MLAFELERPVSFKEALEILSRSGPNTAVKAGGTDLLVWMKKNLVHPELIVDLSLIEELKKISFDPSGGLVIGALATVNEVAEHPQAGKFYPALVDAALSHSDFVMRNKATVVGNLCSAVPSGDMIAPCCVYDGVMHVAGPTGERKVPIMDFITGPRKNILQKGEIAKAVELPVLKGHSAGCYLKLGRRNALDLAQVGVACVITDTPGGREYRLSFGAVTPRPVRAKVAEDLMRGVASPDESLLEKAAEAAMGCVDPITDVRASREYRVSMVGELTKKALRESLERF
jgi:carbon-monoxide dehydrogenase medium subunit